MSQKTRFRKRLKSETDGDDDEFQSCLIEKLDFLKKCAISTESNIKLIMEENKQMRSELDHILAYTKSQSEEIKKQTEVIKIQSEEINKLREKPKSTYAEQLKSNGPVVLIKPKDINQKSEATKKEVKDKINPVDSHINSIRAASKGAIIVECRDMQASEQLKSSALQKLGTAYEVDLPKKRKPKFKICGMSEKLTDDELLDYIIKQNEYLKSSDELKVVKIFERVDLHKNKTYQAIVETDSTAYKKIMDSEKLFIKWDSCRVYEQISVTRCFKCLGFNHFSKDCTKDIKCKKCAESHPRSECNSAVLKCVNCVWHNETLKMQLDTAHDAFSRNCEVLQRKYSQEKRKICVEE